MKSYLKFLSRNKLYTAIEAVGLIVSLAFVILIGSYVRQQWQVAKGSPEWKHYYVVGASYMMIDMAPEGLAWLIKENMPGVDLATMFDYKGYQPLLGDVQIHDENAYCVEPDFFKMFPVEWVEGDDSSLTGDGIAVSEEAVRKYGQGRDLIGQRVISGSDTMFVSAVFRPLKAPIFQDASFLMVRESREVSNMMTGGTSCLISSSLPEKELVRTLDDVLEIHHPLKWGREESRDFKNGVIERLDRVYFSELNKGQSFYKGNSSLLKMLVAVVLLLLLSAIFNYINLSAALAGRRTKEMGMRAILGASRSQVVGRYLRESLLFTAVCSGLAILLAYAFKPVLIRFVEVRNSTREVSVPFTWQWDAASVGALVLLVVAVGLLAGWIPARMASRYNPAQIVKGDYRLRSKRIFSKIFIIFQTALSVLLIAFSLVMERQFSHMIHRPVGADVDGLYYQFRISDAQQDAIEQLPFVSAVGRSDGYPGGRNMVVSTVDPDGVGTLSISSMRMSPEAFRMCGFDVVEDFHNPSGVGVWLSESARNGFGMKPGQTTLPEGVHFFLGTPLAGVLRDFAVTDAAHVEADQWGAVQVLEPSQGSYLLLRVEGDRKEAERQLEAAYARFSEEQFGYVRFADFNGFIVDKLRSGLEEAENYMRLIEMFMILAVLVSLLGLLAMSAFFASEQTHDIAVRKVFGGTVEGEVLLGIRDYMILVLIACVIAVPVAVWMSGRYLEDFYYRISGYGWIFAVAVLITVVISLASVLWQTLKAAKTNPAIELKKE